MTNRDGFRGENDPAGAVSPYVNQRGVQHNGGGEGSTEHPHGVYLQDPDVTLYHGDVLEQLASLPDESVHCVVTSPPYWGLRDYGTGSWDGGDTDCDHVKFVQREQSQKGERPKGWDGNFRNTAEPLPVSYGQTCGKCGAQRTDQQLGLEPTPDLYIERMVQVFREVRRVLRKDGTCWLNIGDSYAGNNGFRPDAPSNQRRAESIGQMDGKLRVSARIAEGQPAGWRTVENTPGLKPKDLVGIPWKLAFALQQDGWWLRADIIWSKPNPMPESVTDRPTKAHEYVFLLTRSPRYFFDQEAVREPHHHDGRSVTQVVGQNGSIQHRDGERWPNAGRNVRSVWTIATEAFPEAHFATFPTELARRCILAGTSERGCCPECGAPWEREIEKGELKPVRGEYIGPIEGNYKTDGSAEVVYKAGKAMVRTSEGWSLLRRETTVVGWHQPSCGHGQSDECGISPLTPIPCTVLDPFVGSGTVPHVARLHNRHAIGIDLNADYLELAARRLQQQSLFASSSTEGAV